MMNLQTDREELLSIATNAARFVEKRTRIPILGTVLIESNGRLVVSATDQEFGITQAIDCKSVTDGAVCVGAHMLVKLLKALPGGVVRLNVKENNFLELSAGTASYKVAGFEASKFPAMPSNAESAESVTMPAALVAEMLTGVLYAASTDETRLNLNGVYFAADAGTVRLCAMDRHRLALIERPVADCPTIAGVILPKKFATELLRLASKKDAESVTLAVKRSKKTRDTVFATCGPVSIFGRVYEGEFPNYTRVITKEFATRCEVDAEALRVSLGRVSLVSSERTHGVRLDCGELGLVVSARNCDIGEASDKLPAAVNGPAITAGFNARYLTDALARVSDGESVELRFVDAISPLTMFAPSDPGLTVVIISMQL